jgi:hypothetical protein
MPVSTLDQATPLPFRQTGTSGDPLVCTKPIELIELRGLTPATVGGRTPAAPATAIRLKSPTEEVLRSLAVADQLAIDIEQAKLDPFVNAERIEGEFKNLNILPRALQSCFDCQSCY